MADIAALRETLVAHGQEHLLHFYETLNPSQQAALVEQIGALDLDAIDGWIDAYVKQQPEVHIPEHLSPPEIIPAGGGKQRSAARARGEQLIAEGKVAAFTVAGGQGTRLGYAGPKGCLPASPIENKPLFRLFAEQIRAAANRHDTTIPWYILTSPVNDEATQAHFQQNDFWGCSPDDVIFIQQGTLPAISGEGKLLLSGPDRLAVSPDGHGGSLTALRHSGALDDMARRGVTTISYWQVDNPLVHVIDPLFIGLHDQAAAQVSAKALPKRDPFEKVGNFCLSDGRVHVIEYSDMPDELAQKSTPSGELLFSAGSIGIHLFDRVFVEHLTAGGQCKLPLHRADKKVPYIDPATGDTVTPEQPNAVKLEMFVFDALPLADRTMLLETRRSEEFSPIKNKIGQDSLPTSLHDQVSRWAAWLETAGVAVPRDADGEVDAAIEISPLFADNAESLATKVEPALAIQPGQKIYISSTGQVDVEK